MPQATLRYTAELIHGSEALVFSSTVHCRGIAEKLAANVLHDGRLQ